ncbi:hypothetical protein [Arsenophonus endosymbiont of Bemisia tabaci]|nr:hypothetical protein [Arsenophonus endosymbiont of Bemisia tabaci]
MNINGHKLNAKKRALGCDTDILFALNMGVIKIKSLSYIKKILREARC